VRGKMIQKNYSIVRQLYATYSQSAIGSAFECDAASVEREPAGRSAGRARVSCVPSGRSEDASAGTESCTGLLLLSGMVLLMVNPCGSLAEIAL
jgi:hypothetical protein